MTLHHHEGEQDASAFVPLTGNTHVQIRFLGWIIAIMGAWLVTTVWWAASMSTKMDQVITNQATALAANQMLSEKLDKIRTELNALEKDYSLHLSTLHRAPAPRPAAITAPKPNP